MRQKKNGKDVRICVDMRRLNLAHKPFIDKYPLSRIDECIDHMAGKTWFSSIDVSASFHQVPIHPDDRYKTAFCTRRGQFQFKKLIMGFSSASAVYSRLTERILYGLLYDIVVAYVDDATVLADSFDEMLVNLDTAFDRFRKAKLKLRPSKCFLFQKEVEFCGQIVSKEGRRVSERRSARLERLDVTDRHSFVETCNNWFSHIQSFIYCLF
jgi:hypothetical protein